MGAKDQGADTNSTQHRWQVVPRTLCFVTYQDQILLLKRAPHKRVFPNHYNGVGGHIEADEDPHSGAIREIHEETGLMVQDVHYCGTTHINAGEAVGILLFIFTAEATTPDFTDSDEGKLTWLPLVHVLQACHQPNPDLPLVEDLPILLPRIFDKKQNALPFFAHVSYDTDDRLLFRFADA